MAEETKKSIIDLFGDKKLDAKRQLTQYVVKGMQLLHSGETGGDIVEVLKGTPNKSQAVAEVTTSVLQRLDTAAREAGDDVHDMIKLEGAVDLLQQVIEIGEVSGATKKFTPEETQAAIALTVQEYLRGEIASGRVNKDELAKQITGGISQMSPEDQEELNKETLRINDTVSESQQPAQGGLLNGITS